MLRINTPPRTDAIWLLCVKEIPEPRPSWEQSAVDFLEMLVKIVRIQTCVLVHQFERVCIKRQIETAANMHSHFHTVDRILEHLLWDTLRNAARTSVTLKSKIYHGHETPGPTRRSGCSGFTGTAESDYSCAFGAETARHARARHATTTNQRNDHPKGGIRNAPSPFRVPGPGKPCTHDGRAQQTPVYVGI